MERGYGGMYASEEKRITKARKYESTKMRKRERTSMPHQFEELSGRILAAAVDWILDTRTEARTPASRAAPATRPG